MLSKSHLAEHLYASDADPESNVIEVHVNRLRGRLGAGYITHELTQDAEAILGSLTVLPSGEATLALTHFDPPFLRPGSSRYFQILVDDGAVLRSPSLDGETLAIPAVNRGRRRVTHGAGPRNQDLLISAVGYEFSGRQITIGVAADLNPIRAQFRHLMSNFSRVSVLMFALLVALQVAIVRLALGTLRRVKTDVGRLERGEITQLGERDPENGAGSTGQSPRWRHPYSGSVSPEPPISAGTSRILGRPSRMRSTDSP